MCRVFFCQLWGIFMRVCEGRFHWVVSRISRHNNSIIGSDWTLVVWFFFDMLSSVGILLSGKLFTFMMVPLRILLSVVIIVIIFVDFSFAIYYVAELRLTLVSRWNLHSRFYAFLMSFIHILLFFSNVGRLMILIPLNFLSLFSNIL